MRSVGSVSAYRADPEKVIRLPYARISDDLLQQQESGSGQPEDNPAEETPEEETPEEEMPVG